MGESSKIVLFIRMHLHRLIKEKPEPSINWSGRSIAAPDLIRGYAMGLVY